MPVHHLLRVQRLPGHVEGLGVAYAEARQLQPADNITIQEDGWFLRLAFRLHAVAASGYRLRWDHRSLAGRPVVQCRSGSGMTLKGQIRYTMAEPPGIIHYTQAGK